MPSTPHDYDSISDADIQLNHLGSDPVTVIENTEVEAMNEENEEEPGQEGVEVSAGTYPTSVIGAVNDSSPQANSRLMMSDRYSSLKNRQITQSHLAAGGLYSQLDVHAALVAEVNEREQLNDTVERIPQSYYNIP